MIEEPKDRLKKAREDAGYETATDAAKAMGVKVPTYTHHENGTAGLSRAGERYARFFRVSLEWLLTGRGEMRPSAEHPTRSIPMYGVVGAGAAVEMIDDPAAHDPAGWIDVPDDGEIGALEVRGDSQWPRFLDGEVVLFDPRPVQPSTLVGKYAIVQTMDGRRLIKILRRAPDNKWRLESHNAPPEDVELVNTWRYLGVMNHA
ncbi:hypothetical protein SAMN06265338_1084 [Rhodoblastus acidophilus]|uniref:HTH cro/C1-type domain-containing protein n=1 Tax=Rhodoblastus acidophilus TaxID=1074 RepID=A0A212RVP4_RHOAC|nr:XRE family transcriptional regulator [Rhodoblastus acidophilus]MCW2315127.1 phage repressor protein C with HTH and peptisase S24 domain [Rhodoblastus acidophilus]SNB76697.1 hypothetical protein SAMN06265338_1084 [Rhodoblastus acidophilus]